MRLGYYNYKSANDLLADRTSRVVAAGTCLVRDGELIHMEYNSTNIVTMHPDGRVVLKRGHSSGIGTRWRMDHCLDDRFRVYVDRDFWHVVPCNKPYRDAPKYSFRDGITLHPDGTVTGHDPKPLSDKLKAYWKASHERNKLYSVESAGGFTVGDVVREEYFEYGYLDNNYQRIVTRRGPFKIRKIMAKQPGYYRQRVLIWLEGMNGEKLSKDYARLPIRQWQRSFKRDNFLSAASQAIRKGLPQPEAHDILA